MLEVGYEKKEDMYNDNECTYAKQVVVPDCEAEKYIKELLLDGSPFSLVRLGETENRVFQNSENIEFPIKSFLEKRKIYNTLFYNFFEGAGFFPENINLIPEFVDVYKDSIKNADIFAVNGWDKEENFVEDYCKGKKIIKSSALNYFFWSNAPWTEALRGKKVLVIHPFAETIMKQYQYNRLGIWNGKNTLPEMELYTYKPVQQFKELNDKRYKTWFDALDAMTADINRLEFDVAILGCGAYGLPLASRIRERNKTAIHLAGSTQLLFGIKGKRWENSARFDSLYNDFWIRPSENETPRNRNTVEGGCYW